MPQVVDEKLAEKGSPAFSSLSARRLELDNADRAAIMAGEKTQIRHLRRATWRVLRRTADPGPVIAYTPRADGLMVTTVIWAGTPWIEPIGSITPEGIRAEGYETYEEFMAYMKGRYERDFGPMTNCRVQPVRPLTEQDIEDFKELAWTRLYGRYA